MTKLIVGCGYLGTRVARAWLVEGHPVFALTRSSERAELLRQACITPVVADVTDPNVHLCLPVVETVLYSVGFDRSGRTRAGGEPLFNASRHNVQVVGLQRVLDAISSATRRIIYISSTGVYAQRDGGWVNEESSATAEHDSGAACLEAEATLASHTLASRAVILRLAALYGAGRLPRLADLLAGKPLAGAGDAYLNLIQADDAVAVILAAERAAEPSPRYCVSDGHPVQRGKFYAELARLTNAPVPRFATPDGCVAGMSRSNSDKRVSNARMLNELRVRLRYPTYREGLAAAVATGTP